MTTSLPSSAQDDTSGDRPAAAYRGASVLSDSLVVTWRTLKRIPRIPELALFAILQSVMFVLLFAFVFGGAIQIAGGASAYREFLMPGIFAQTIAFASATVAIGVTDDMAKGIVDRFRSLPMARSAYLTGRTVSEIVYQAGILVVLMLTGLAVGWRVRGGFVDFWLGVGLLLLFTYAMAWIGVWLGQLVRTVEVGQQVAFTVVFPITFISNVFVPPDSLPKALQPIAEWNPVSTLASATRELWGNPNPYVTAEGFPAQHPALLTVLWMVAVIAVFAPLGIARYRRTSQ